MPAMAMAASGFTHGTKLATEPYARRLILRTEWRRDRIGKISNSHHNLAAGVLIPVGLIPECVMIIFRCSCGKQLQVNDDRAGSKVKCPECEEILRVPEAGSIREKSGPASPPPKTRPRPVEDDESFAEEERRPRGRPARFDEDEYDDRPRRRSSRYHE